MQREFVGGGDAVGVRLPTVTMIGGGQLARMTHEAVGPLGQSLRVLASSTDDPAALITPDVLIGSHDNLDDLRMAAMGSNVVTFDHEGVPIELLEKLVDEGAKVYPPPSALGYAQNKLAMRLKMSELSAALQAAGGDRIRQPDYRELVSPADVVPFYQAHDGQIVIKAVRGGYDGRGVWMPASIDEASDIVSAQLSLGTPLMAEQKVSLARELSAMVARSPFGQGASWPVVETIQRHGQCAVVVAPAPGLAEERRDEAIRIALRIASELGVVGVMAVELFETHSGELLINELAMRPHNSGHWTQDGCVTSQFEQHLRAVLDYPLGATDPTASVTVMANVLGSDKPVDVGLDERLHHLFARIPEAKVHMYAKEERPERKIGHVNVSGDDLTSVRDKAERAATWLSTGVWTDGWEIH